MTFIFSFGKYGCWTVLKKPFLAAACQAKLQLGWHKYFEDHVDKKKSVHWDSDKILGVAGVCRTHHHAGLE